MAVSDWEYAPCTVPPASGDGVVIARVGVMVSVSAWVVEAEAASLTRTVKLKVPEAVGVPLKAPGPLKVSPPGTVPAMTDHASVPVPPVAVMVFE